MARRLLEQPVSQSPLTRALLTALAQLRQIDFLIPCEPIVVGTPARPRLRVGVFHYGTDRDAFIAALLGRPVPRRPRYELRGPAVDAELASIPARFFDTKEMGSLRGSSSAEVAAEAYRLRNIAKALTDDPALRPAVGELVGSDPAAFVDLPVGRQVVRAARGAGGRRGLSGSDHLEFAWLEEADPVGWIGFAWWLPGDLALRAHRAHVAAHLRYLFDSYVAPWNRWPDERTRREAAYLFLGNTQRLTIQAVALERHQRFPDLYVDEALEVTIRRLRRINPEVRRPLKVTRPRT